MTSQIPDHLAALEHAAKAKFDAIIAPAKAEYESTLADIAALRRKLSGTAAVAAAVHASPSGNGVHNRQSDQNKTDRVLRVLSSEYKKVTQLASESGLTTKEVAHVLSQKRIGEMLQRRGEPRQTEYRLSKASAETKLGTTDAILSVLRSHPAGLAKKALTDEVEKVSPSSSKTPRNAIQATISKMWNEGAIKIDSADVCTIAH